MAFSFQTPPPQLQLPQPSPFQTPQQQSSLFQNPQIQQQQQQQQQQLSQQSPFQFQPQPQPQQQIQIQHQQQPASTVPQQQFLLYTKDRAPAGYNTNWEDLHPDSQKLLLQIEERILEYKHESQRLDQCSRLYDSSVSGDSFEANSSRIIQELGLITAAMEREKVSVQDLMASANKMMWDTEFAIRSYMMLRSSFLRQSVPTSSNVASGSPNTGYGTASKQTNQLASGSVAPVFDFYRGIPKRPSLFMEQTAARFEKYLTECYQWIEEVEQLVMLDNKRMSSNSLDSLPQVVSNVHDFFIHVAAKVENLHQHVESMKTAYLADQRRQGNVNDPFLEANRREAAQQEAAAKRVHPTLHLPAISAQPTSQVSSAFTSLVAPSTSSVQPSAGPSAASSGSGFSLFSTPSSAPTASSSSSFLFSTPTAPSPTSTLFGSSGFSLQSTPFGTPSTSLFGSTQTPSGLAINTSSFGSTPVGSSLFSTPLAAAGTGGSGASFGPSKSSRPKSRTSRR
ncbi:nuclear pore complex protein NUP58-like isoform X2 [Zingiber officinale]|uniref:nuclear pore complex protein NUP58-like isoform X2 n=1 Tax=Zingiber officinale TaxID=94328 RepID=UPI001C4AFBC3|nr:nuclear pore complex protein NUP58-like isoform X2 [Zingiber officinale]